MIEILIDKIPGRERDPVEQLTRFAVQAGFATERVEDIRTAAREACLNAIEHGSASGVVVTLRYSLSGRTILVEVESEGEMFDITRVRPEMSTRIEGVQSPRGWGIYFMKTLADSVEVRFDQGRSVVSMKFHDQSEAGGPNVES